MEEIWKDIKGYEGLYQISNLGRVKSLDKILNWGNITFTKKGKILSPSNDKDGYKMVNLCLNATQHKPFKIHRLVAQAFIPNPYNYSEINHKDEDKTNNSVDNLEWCNRNHNMIWNNLNLKISQKLKNGISSKAIVQLTKDGDFIAEYPSLREAERVTGFSHGNISNCINGRLKTYKGYIWQTKNVMNIGVQKMEDQ